MFPLYDTVRSRRFPLVNWLLIVANVAAFLYELQLNGQALTSFINTWGLVPAHLMNDPLTAWVTIITAMFLHGGWFHILSNMWFLFIFGDNVEDRMGSLRYLVFYLLSGAAAGLLQSYLLANDQQPMIGASGAIAGVLGAYLVLFPRAKIASLVPILFIFTVIEVPVIIYLLIWFVSQLFSGLIALNADITSGIAWWAHIGGFIFGMVSVIFFTRRPRLEYRN